jgi:hypothetical protein
MASSSLTLNPSRSLISKSIYKVRDTDLPAPWPATCVECDLVLADREAAERHRDQTEHEDVVVPATDHDMQMFEFQKAVNKWVSAQCFDCGAQFTDHGEACEHERIFPNHALLHAKDATVN